MAEYQGKVGGEENPKGGGPPLPRSGRDLTQGRVSTVLLVFSLPIVAQMSIQPLFSMIDSWFISQIGAEAFSAVINADLIQLLAITLSAGLANGVSSHVARLTGAGELKEADNAAVHSMIVLAAVSLLYAAVFLPFDQTFFRLLGIAPELMPLSHKYVRIIVLGNFLIMFNLVGANVLRGEGNSSTPFWIAFASLAINVFTAPVLIFGPGERVWGLPLGYFGLGVEGAALAIVIGRALGCLFLILYLLRGKSLWTFTLKNFHWSPHHLAEILKVGLPMFLVNLSAWAASLVFIRLLNHNPAAVVAYGLGARFDMLAILPMIGLMLGVVAMVGQNYGAGKLERARSAAYLGGLYAAAFCLAMGLLYLSFPGFIVGLFNKDNLPEIQNLGRSYIYIVALTYPLVAQVFVLGGAFQGLGKGLPPLVITATRFLAIAIPLALLLTPRVGPIGAFIAVAASHVVGGVFSIIWLGIEFKGRRG